MSFDSGLEIGLHTLKHCRYRKPNYVPTASATDFKRLVQDESNFYDHNGDDDRQLGPVENNIQGNYCHEVASGETKDGHFTQDHDLHYSSEGSGTLDSEPDSEDEEEDEEPEEAATALYPEVKAFELKIEEMHVDEFEPCLKNPRFTEVLPTP